MYKLYHKNNYCVNKNVKVQIGLRLLRKNETVNELGNFYIIAPPLAPPPTGRSTLCKQRGGENKEYSYFSSPLPKGNSTRRRRDRISYLVALIFCVVSKNWGDVAER